MTTLSLPEGNAFGVDDTAGGTPIVNYAENREKTLFFVWVTLSEHKWVILGERRGVAPALSLFINDAAEAESLCGDVGYDVSPLLDFLRRVPEEIDRRAHTPEGPSRPCQTPVRRFPAGLHDQQIVIALGLRESGHAASEQDEALGLNRLDQTGHDARRVSYNMAPIRKV